MTKANKAEPASSTSQATANASHSSEAIPPRRHWFFSAASIVLGALVGLIPAGIGLAAFLDPWRRHPRLPTSRSQGGTTSTPEGFIRVASLGALKPGTAPQRFAVIAHQLDAWNFSPDQPIGAVFLQRVDEKTVRCFNATCPHAGCSVACNGQVFLCPCHNSSFQLDGVRRPPESGRENPSPRDLDVLEVDPEKLANGEVWVRFQNFYTGQHEKIPKT
jgi:menaquinol-cytochrome c reductase iron-sulfur subunit